MSPPWTQFCHLGRSSRTCCLTRAARSCSNSSELQQVMASHSKNLERSWPRTGSTVVDVGGGVHCWRWLWTFSGAGHDLGETGRRWRPSKFAVIRRTDRLKCRQRKYRLKWRQRKYRLKWRQRKKTSDRLKCRQRKYPVQLLKGFQARGVHRYGGRNAVFHVSDLAAATSVLLI